MQADGRDPCLPALHQPMPCTDRTLDQHADA
jgi:hypothetical protein